MTFRDKSADTTLNNANEEIMRTKYARSDPRNPDPKGDFARRARLEAEIDALKLEIKLSQASERKGAENNVKLIEENIKLKAENETLRVDAERLCKAAEKFQGAASELWKSENPDETTCQVKGLDSARELYSDSWIALNVAIHYMRKNAAMKDFSTTQKEDGAR